MKKIIFVLMLVLITGNLSSQGLTKHGELTNSSTAFIDKNGKTSSTPALNQSGAVPVQDIALTSIAAISGTPNVGVGLSAGALSPSGTTATYQWTICETVGGTYTNISGATSNNYTTVAADLGKFIKVVATGSGGSTGTVTSAAVGALGAILSTTIDAQIWTTKNLDVTTYSDGTEITYTANATEWANANNAGVGAWCYYNFDANNGPTYGKLYNWYAARDARGLAPAGWHVAGDADWATLASSLGGETIAGGKLKEAGTSHWQPSNTGATNSSGFTALPGGYINVDGAFYGIGSFGYWWGITAGGVAYDRELHYGESVLKQFSLNQTYGFAVRCVQN